MRGSNGAWLPASPSTVSAPATIDASSSRSAWNRPSSASASEQLRAVQERKPFLGLGLERLAADRAQHLGVRERGAVAGRLTLTDQHQRQVRERREVP